jgi:hypothetical protein
VRKDRTAKIVPGTFIATMKSGHKGVFWREWHDQVKKPKDKNMVYGRLPQMYRLKIKERSGPRVPDIMGNDPVMKIILAKAEVRLHNNLEHELEYEMSKM